MPDYRAHFRNVAVDPAFELAVADPLLAAETLARGLRRQTRGAKISAIRMLAAALARDERPGFTSDVITELARHQ